MNFVKKILTQSLLTHILIAIVIFIVLIWGTFVVLKIYTNHGQSFSVPDFRGMTMSEVKKLCNEKKLRYKISDSVFNSFQKKGTVVEQTPSPNSKVKENRRIFLIMNASQPEMVNMPNLIDKTLIQAKADLERLDLSVGSIEYIPDIGKNIVLKQKFEGGRIPAGSKIAKGSYIDLTLGKGIDDNEENNKTLVPDLLGLEKRQAINKATNSFLNIKGIVFDRSIQNYTDSIRAVVYKQNPERNRKQHVVFGSSIDIWLTVDKAKIKAINEKKKLK